MSGEDISSLALGVLSWAGGQRKGYFSPLRGIVSPLLPPGGDHFQICGWGGKSSSKNNLLSAVGFEAGPSC